MIERNIYNERKQLIIMVNYTLSSLLDANQTRFAKDKNSGASEYPTTILRPFGYVKNVLII